MVKIESEQEKFNNLICDIEEVILIKAPKIKREAMIIEKSEFFDIGDFNKNNKDLDLLKNKYKELYNEIIRMDKIKGTQEIKAIIRNKKLLDKNIENKYNLKVKIDSMTIRVEDDGSIININTPIDTSGPTAFHDNLYNSGWKASDY